MNSLVVENEPAVGQCAVTALVVQDYCGGEILNTVVSHPDYPELTSSHYFNLIGGKVVDLTRQQFVNGVVFSEPQPKLEGFPTTRDYMLSVPSTAERYELLKANVQRLG